MYFLKRKCKGVDNFGRHCKCSLQARNDDPMSSIPNDIQGKPLRCCKSILILFSFLYCRVSTVNTHKNLFSAEVYSMSKRSGDYLIEVSGLTLWWYWWKYSVVSSSSKHYLTVQAKSIFRRKCSMLQDQMFHYRNDAFYFA